MSSKYINSRMTYQEDGIDYQDNDFIALLQKHLQNALLEIDALKAQVNYLRDVLLDERKRYHVAKDLDEALEATPEHCLAEVKAKAIEGYKKEQAEIMRLDLSTKIMMLP